MFRPTRAAALCWGLVAAAVLVQIVYPLVPAAQRTPVTVLSVLVFAVASLADITRRHGPRAAVALLAVAGVGGLAVEALGVRTGWPFGEYTYTGTLGPEVVGVPMVVPLAWIMMAWPALVVGRTLGRGPAGVALVSAAALASWDVFLDPQMVDAGYWRWARPEPALPLVPGVPLTNFAGWLLVALVMTAVLHRVVPPDRGLSGPASALYLWTYGSSVVAHVAFFDRPGSALVGGVLMGVVAWPFAWALARPVRERRGSRRGPAGAAGRATAPAR